MRNLTNCMVDDTYYFSIATSPIILLQKDTVCYWKIHIKCYFFIPPRLQIVYFSQELLLR